MSDISITSSDIAEKPSSKLVKFSGQLDETNIEQEAKKVYAMMEGNGVKNFVFDFSDLSYLNSK